MAKSPWYFFGNDARMIPHGTILKWDGTPFLFDLETRMNVLETNYVRTTRFATIGAGTSGTVTLPSNSEVVLDDFGGTVDAVISSIVAGKPDFLRVTDSFGTVIATSFDALGNYVLTGTPSSYPVAIIYRVRQRAKYFDSTSSDILGIPSLIISALDGGSP